MHQERTMISWIRVALLAGLCGACTTADTAGAAGGGGGGGGDQSPVSGRFAGTYDVPVPEQLAAAATYPVDEIEWRFDGGTLTLDYDLPRGLVGKSLHVRFEGAYDGEAETVTLTGDAGTAECTIGADRIDCHETMRGLLPIDVDEDAVEDIARDEYDGPVQDRLDVAERFSGDPIGIAHLDLGARKGGSGDDG